MRSPVAGIVILILLFLAVIVAYSSIFTVSQTEQALVVRLGRPVDVVSEPGLNFKAPFIDTVISIDKRILDLENPSQEVIASDQKRLVVDAFARYRIKDALRFYQSVGSIQAANLQLTTLLNAALRRVLGEVAFITVVRDEREALMAKIRGQLGRRTSLTARPEESIHTHDVSTASRSPNLQDPRVGGSRSCGCPFLGYPRPRWGVNGPVARRCERRVPGVEPLCGTQHREGCQPPGVRVDRRDGRVERGRRRSRASRLVAARRHDAGSLGP